jgi:hypothetical protein
MESRLEESARSGGHFPFGAGSTDKRLPAIPTP